MGFNVEVKPIPDPADAAINVCHARDTASFEDLKGNGQVEIVIRDGTFDFGFGLDHAFSLFPLLVVRLRETQFIDV